VESRQGTLLQCIFESVIDAAPYKLEKAKGHNYLWVESCCFSEPDFKVKEEQKHEQN